MSETKSFSYNDINCEYIITYKQQKHMYLKVRGNQILISAPFYMQKDIVESFIIKNLPKILAKQGTLKPYFNIDGKNDYLYFLSEKYPIIIKYHRHKTTINFEFNNLVIYTNSHNYKQVMLKIQKFLKQESYHLFMKRLLHWAEIMNLTFAQLKIRSMISKWGICQPYAKIITLNYKLIHYCYNVIDYVIIHELAHFIHSHHQKTFWKVVAQFCPNFKDCQKVLKQYGGQ